MVYLLKYLKFPNVEILKYLFCNLPTFNMTLIIETELDLFIYWHFPQLPYLTSV